MPSSRRTPAAAQIPTGGYGIHPYGRRRMPRPTGKLRPPVTTNLCRGRCLHCARRRVSEANRAAGPALRPEIVPGTPRWRKVSREGHGPPLQTTENDRPNRTAATTQATVGRDALIPPHPRGGANARGRDKSRPHDQRKARTQPGNGNLAVPQAPVGDDACIVPHPAAAQTPAGGINPAPTIDGRPVPNRGTSPLQPMGASAFMAFRFPPGRTPTRGRRHPPRSGAAARRTRRAAAAGGSAAS